MKLKDLISASHGEHFRLFDKNKDILEEIEMFGDDGYIINEFRFNSFFYGFDSKIDAKYFDCDVVRLFITSEEWDDPIMEIDGQRSGTLNVILEVEQEDD